MKRSFIKAFTLVELLVVIAILAILSTVGIIGYNSFTEKAYVSNDETRAELINRHLQMYQLDNPINSEDDLKIVIDEMYGEEAFNKLEPQSAKYGYHYWFNIETKQVRLSKVEDLNAGHGINYLTKTNRFDAKGSLRASLVPGFLLLDRSGSDIANALSNIDSISSAEDYENVIKNTIKAKNSDNDGKLGTILEKKLETTSIVSNDGTFRYSDVNKVDSIYYTVGTNSISSVLHEYDGKDVITSYLSNANIKYIANGVNFVLPSNIINVDSYSFYFDDNNIPTLSTSLEESQLLEVFKANATNAIIELTKDEVVNQYKFENGTLKNITTGVEIGTPDYSNPVQDGDFIIKCLEDNNGKVKQLDKLYVAYDQKTFNLEAEFVDDSVSSQEVLWSSQNSELVSIDLEGKATIESLPEVGSTYEVTLRATALAGGHYEEVTVFIVRPTQGNITLGETYPLLVNNLELGNTIDINYDGSVSTFDFTDLYLSYNINDVVSVETDYEITTNGDLFEIVGNSEDGYSLNLKEFDGTQELTITVGDYFSKTFTINVIDNSASPFELKFKNTDKYMYRLGNANEVSLSSLFALTEGKDISNKTIKFNIYDASKTTGDNILSNIATSEEGFSASYKKELTASNWENSTIDFNGSGVAILEIGTGNLTTRLVVEVIDGVNVTKPSQIGGTQNLIFINDINYIKGVDYSDVSYLSINGITLYGNGFSFNARDYVATTNCMIALQNGNIDNLVINGPVVPEVVYGAYTKYYASGIQTYGNCQITNSFISGFKSPVKTQNGTLLLDNVTLFGGTYANLDVFGLSELTLNNVTTVQRAENATVGSDLTKQVKGAGIVFSSSTANIPFTINGELVQLNWLTESDKNYLPDIIKANFDRIFGNNEYSSYIHTINGSKYFNCGIVFEGYRTKEITDNRINKTDVCYSSINVSDSLLGVTYSATMYTINNSKGSISQVPVFSSYESNKQSLIAPKFTYQYNVDTFTNTDKHFFKTENGIIKIGINDAIGDTYTFDIHKGVLINKYENEFSYNVSCDGGMINGDSITFNSIGNYKITYTVSDNLFYDINGNSVNKIVNYSYYVIVNVSTTSIDNATITASLDNKYTVYGKTGTLLDPDYYRILSLDCISINDNGKILTGTQAYNEGKLLMINNDGTYKYATYNGTTYIYHSTASNRKAGDKYLDGWNFVTASNQTLSLNFEYRGINGNVVNLGASITFTWTSSSKVISWSSFTNL